MPRLSPLAHERPLPGRFRARLHVEVLEWRDQPSGFGDGASTEPILFGDERMPVNTAPMITDFTAEEIGQGLFLFTGRVIDEAPDGLVVTFGGGVPSVAGRTAVADEDGSFSFLVRLPTDGSESGTVSATTTDSQGATSNEALVYVSPTP